MERIIAYQHYHPLVVYSENSLGLGHGVISSSTHINKPTNKREGVYWKGVIELFASSPDKIRIPFISSLLVPQAKCFYEDHIIRTIFRMDFRFQFQSLTIASLPTSHSVSHSLLRHYLNSALDLIPSLYHIIIDPNSVQVCDVIILILSLFLGTPLNMCDR